MWQLSKTVMKNPIKYFMGILLLLLFSCEKQRFEFQTDINVTTTFTVEQQFQVISDIMTKQDLLDELDLESGDQIKSIKIKSVEVGWIANQENTIETMGLNGLVKDFSGARFKLFGDDEDPNLQINVNGDEGKQIVNNLIDTGVDILNSNMATMLDPCNTDPFNDSFGYLINAFAPPGETLGIDIVVKFNITVKFYRCLETVIITGGDECDTDDCGN